MPRQQVNDFLKRLDALARNTRHEQGKRVLIDTTGSRSVATASKSLEHRLHLYGQRRLATVARLLLLTQKAAAGNPALKTMEVSATGAFWQAFTGTDTMPACHTSPCLLLFDGHLPTVPVQSPALKRQLILNFGDCMLMPRAVNKIDSVVDDHVGRYALADSATMVLQGAPPLEAAHAYARTLRELYAGLLDLSPAELQQVQTSMTRPDRKDMLAEGDLQIAYDALSTYDEVLMFGVSKPELQQFEYQVDAELAGSP